MSLNVIDFEVFAKDWLCVIVNPIEKTETVIINDVDKLKKFYEKHSNEIFIGYNIRSYDQYIFKALLLDMNVKAVNDFIIQDGNKGWMYSSLFNRIPLNIFDIMISMHSLKQLEAFMGVGIHESSVDFTLDRKLTAKELAETVDYCKADVYNTLRIFIERKEEFDGYMSMLKMFNLPMSYLGKTKAQLTASILGAVKTKRDDEFDIQIVDTLQLGKYQHIRDWYMNPENYDYEKELNTTVSDVPHTFGYGGLHGALDNYIDEGLFLNIDVTSYYPSLMIEYDFGSRNADFKKYKEIYDLRLQLKKEGKKKEQAPLKIVLNATYGASKDKYNPLYDPRQANNVCINGQLLLLDLIEKLEHKCKLIQSNTDGILIKITKNNIDEVKSICEEWSKRTKMVLEYEEFVKVIQRDVNNYLIVDVKGQYKSKGAVVKKLSNLDNDLPIVNKAVTNYFLFRMRPEDTIFACEDMIQFQQVFKVSGKYMYAMRGEEILNGKCFRVFASRSQNDGGIFKKKTDDKNKEKFANSPERVFIENGDITNMKVPRKLDRKWYIDLAYKRIKQFIGEK